MSLRPLDLPVSAGLHRVIPIFIRSGDLLEITHGVRPSPAEVVAYVIETGELVHVLPQVVRLIPSLLDLCPRHQKDIADRVSQIRGLAVDKTGVSNVVEPTAAAAESEYREGFLRAEQTAGEQYRIRTARDIQRTVFIFRSQVAERVDHGAHGHQIRFYEDHFRVQPPAQKVSAV